MSPKWIDFREIPGTNGKTRQWNVFAKDGQVLLGMVKWWSPWRRYVFIPATDTLFEQDCLRDIAAAIEEATTAVRSTWKRTSRSVGS